MHFRNWKIISALLSLVAFACFYILRSNAAYYNDNDSSSSFGQMVVVSLTAEEIPKYINYPGTKVTSVVKVKVSYQEVDKNKDKREVKYEDLLYANGRPIGLVRYHHFDPANCQIMITVNQAQLTDAEMRPIANAMIRLYLDAFLIGGNKLYSCIVPDDSFDSMTSAFQAEKFYSPSGTDDLHQLNPMISLTFHTTSSGQNRALLFALQ